MANTYTNAFADLTDTSLTTVYTTPGATTAIVQAINVANVNASDTVVTVKIYDYSTTTDFTLLNEGTIPGDSTLQAVDRPLVLEANDAIKVQAATGDYLEVIISILEIT